MAGETAKQENGTGQDGLIDPVVISPSVYIGDFIDKICPKCRAALLGNQAKDEWCSSPSCDYGVEDMKEILGL